MRVVIISRFLFQVPPLNHGKITGSFFHSSSSNYRLFPPTMCPPWIIWTFKSLTWFLGGPWLSCEEALPDPCLTVLTKCPSFPDLTAASISPFKARHSSVLWPMSSWNVQCFLGLRNVLFMIGWGFLNFTLLVVRISEGVVVSRVQSLVTCVEALALILLPIRDLASDYFDVSAEGWTLTKLIPWLVYFVADSEITLLECVLGYQNPRSSQFLQIVLPHTLFHPMS